MDLSQDLVRSGHVSPSGPKKLPTALDRSLDRRREQRFSMTGTIRIGWVGGEHQMRYTTTRAMNISAEGLGVWSPQPLPLGALLHVDLGGCGMSAVARVRWCVADASGWRAGFEMLKSFPSDPADFPSE